MFAVSLKQTHAPLQRASLEWKVAAEAIGFDPRAILVRLNAIITRR